MKSDRPVLKTLLLGGLLLLGMACSLESMLPPIPTDIPIPTTTDTPAPLPLQPALYTSTPINLETTPIAPASAGTPLPPATTPITADNAGQVIPLAWQGRGIPEGMALSKDGSLLAISTTRGVYIYDAATLTEIQRIETALPQLVLAFSPDGKSVASTGIDGAVSLWQVQDGRLLRRFISNAFSTLTALVFSPDGARLVGTGTDRVTHIWQAADGVELDPIRDNARIVQSLSFSADGAALFSWAPVEPVKVWNPETRQKMREIAVSADDLGKNAINGVFSADGSVFAANSGLRVHVYNTRTGFTRQLIPLKDPARYLLLSGDGSQLAVIGQKQLSLYQVGGKDPPLVLPLPAGFPDSNACLFTPDGSALFQLDQGLSTWKLEKDGSPVLAASDFAPDYSIASVFPDDPPSDMQVMLDGSLQVRDRAGVLQKAIRLNESALVAAAISPDGSSLATSGEQNGVVLWSPEGKLQTSLSPLPANSLALSSTGLLAGAMPDSRVTLWQVPAGSVKLDIKMDNPPQQVLISADGKMLAARTRDAVTWWDVSGSAERKVGRYAAYGMALSPDGQFLAVSVSGLAGRSIEIHKRDGSDPLGVLDNGGAWMSFSPDASLLAVAGDPLTLWRVNDGGLAGRLSANGLLGRPVFIDRGRLLGLVSWDGSLQLWGVP